MPPTPAFFLRGGDRWHRCFVPGLAVPLIPGSGGGPWRSVVTSAFPARPPPPSTSACGLPKKREGFVFWFHLAPELRAKRRTNAGSRVIRHSWIRPPYPRVRSGMILAKWAAARSGPLALTKGKYHASPSPHSARHNRGLCLLPANKELRARAIRNLFSGVRNRWVFRQAQESNGGVRVAVWSRSFGIGFLAIV